MVTTNLSALYLYEDEYIFALNKPAGLHSVGLKSGGRASLADLLLTHNPGFATVSKNECDAGLVQRLDLDTSGIILGAKTREIWILLHNEIAKGAFVKRYIALVDGAFKEPTTISSYIGSPNRGARKMHSYKDLPTKNIRALFGTSNFVAFKKTEDNCRSFVEVSASPARRHQVRVHAAQLGHPLTGDTLYGSKQSLPSKLKQTSRAFFLHAHYIKGVHPITKQPLEIHSSLEHAGIE